MKDKIDQILIVATKNATKLKWMQSLLTQHLVQQDIDFKSVHSKLDNKVWVNIFFWTVAVASWFIWYLLIAHVDIMTILATITK